MTHLPAARLPSTSTACERSDGYASSGTIAVGGGIVEGSGVPGLLATEEDALDVSNDWARTWVDSHG
jgi:hypothetical protein